MFACCACRIARSSRAALICPPPASTSVLLSTQSPARQAALGRQHRAVERRHEVRAHEREDDQPRRGEDDERRGHRGHRAPQQQPREHADGEREDGVGGHDEPLDVEPARRHPPLQRVEGLAPPHHDRAREPGRDDGRGGEQHRLREQPAATGDRLRPGEPVGALLELAREERRADEQPRERGQHGQPAHGRRPASELALEVGMIRSQPGSDEGGRQSGSASWWYASEIGRCVPKPRRARAPTSNPSPTKS